MMGTLSRFPIYPTMPHMVVTTSVVALGFPYRVTAAT